MPERQGTRLAFYTFGILRAPQGHAQVQGFVDRIPGVSAASWGAAGYLAAVRNRPPGFGPRFYDPAVHAFAPQTLSVWADLESVFAFAYHGPHAEALRGRREWFVTPPWPTYAAWWVAGDHLPTWDEAAARLEHLHDHGPTPFAFSFKHPFDPDGRPTALAHAPVTARATTGA